jgi:DNA-binding NtrC family response regulator
MSGAILLVEDSPVLGPLLQAVLTGGGHPEVLLAADAPEALAVAQRYGGEISVLVTDLGLPSTRGDLLAHELQRRIPGLAVVISGYTDHRGVPIGALPAWKRLEKPFTMESLIAAVELSLAGRSGTADQ